MKWDRAIYVDGDGVVYQKDELIDKEYKIRKTHKNQYKNWIQYENKNAIEYRTRTINEITTPRKKPKQGRLFE